MKISAKTTQFLEKKLAPVGFKYLATMRKVGLLEFTRKLFFLEYRGLKFAYILLFLFLPSLTLASTNSEPIKSMSEFCNNSRKILMSTTQKITDESSKIEINHFLSDLRNGKIRDEIILSDALIFPTLNFFAPWDLRLGRTFMIESWDLKRLLEMQVRTDLIVIGSIDQEKIELVKNAIKSTGIRIFPVSIGALPNEMEQLAKQSGGVVIHLPTRCF